MKSVFTPFCSIMNSHFCISLHSSRMYAFISQDLQNAPSSLEGTVKVWNLWSSLGPQTAVTVCWPLRRIKSHVVHLGEYLSSCCWRAEKRQAATSRWQFPSYKVLSTSISPYLMGFRMLSHLRDSRISATEQRKLTLYSINRFAEC